MQQNTPDQNGPETGSADNTTNTNTQKDKTGNKTGTGPGPNLVRDKRPKTYDEAVQERASDLTACAKAHSDSLIKGETMNAVITIAASGTARSVVIQPETVNAAPLGACLRNVLMKARYPTAGSDQKLTLPFKPKF